MALAENLPKRGFQELLDKLLDIRLNLAYGEQTDYFDDANCIGWTRKGMDDGQPIAVLISNDQATSKSMLVGPGMGWQRIQ